MLGLWRKHAKRNELAAQMRSQGGLSWKLSFSDKVYVPVAAVDRKLAEVLGLKENKHRKKRVGAKRYQRQKRVQGTLWTQNINTSW